MRIAQIAPIIERVPPKKYGGTERMIHALTEELVKMGHDVTLFATGDSKTSARLVSVVPKALRESKTKNLYGANAWNLLHLGLAYKMQDRFDIIHDHNGDLCLPTANIARTPVVLTLHGAFNNQVRTIFDTLDNINLVSISNSQRKSMPDLNYVGTVFNGLNLNEYPFSAEPDNYLLLVGRISFNKGIHHAIRTSVQTGIPLIIAAKVETESASDMRYLHQVIKPLLRKYRKLVTWVGEVDDKLRNKLMSKALCLLHPVIWEEPFGLVLIEAMACGTPVIGFNRGSIPEVVTDKKVGFVVSNRDQMARAVKKIDRISRFECREYALEQFSAAKMAKGYVEVYEKIIRKNDLLRVQPEMFIPTRFFSNQKSNNFWLNSQRAKKAD